MSCDRYALSSAILAKLRGVCRKEAVTARNNNIKEASHLLSHKKEKADARNTTGAELVLDGENTIQLYPIIND